MNNQNKTSPFQSPPAKKPVRQSENFVEALKSIGGHTAKSFKDDLIKGTAGDLLSSLTGSGKSPKSPYEQAGHDSWPESWLNQAERRQEKDDPNRLDRHREVVSTPIYDRQQEEVKAQIDALRQELRALAKEMAGLGQSVQKAVEEEVVNPGTYHIGFFEQLKRYIKLLRKQVSESKNWLALSAQRKQSQKHYWGQVQKSGTKFMLSQERYMATQAG